MSWDTLFTTDNEDILRNSTTKLWVGKEFPKRWLKYNETYEVLSYVEAVLALNNITTY